MEGKRKPHLLITNDDGVLAPGLLALAEALQSVGSVSVVAPDHNWSAAGHSKTMHKPLRADPTILTNGIPAFVTTGAPSDAIALGVMGLVPLPVDMVIAGINRGANLGHDVTYSGTVTAAMEGAISGIPAIAVSLDSSSSAADYSPAATFVARLVERAWLEGLPPSVLLNVNVPALPGEQIKGVQVTRMGQRIYRDQLVRREDPLGRPYYWIGGEVPTGVVERGTDFGAVSQGYISITPLQLDFTAFTFLDVLHRWGVAEEWGNREDLQ